ncbi:DNA internalization-related competence protein ComEC/Rec2 [Vandammella animalimorsus]|uniref:DNA internalization-related competence protein ComEC/Rec2 n=1 Tax=Vandammella animalimorsus TaxID=2029117 RepID=UPI001EED7634|nr:DNA internalization-related competence protein ComEC/Rec2 [Vandammella animalimorsus]
MNSLGKRQWQAVAAGRAGLADAGPAGLGACRAWALLGAGCVGLAVQLRQPQLWAWGAYLALLLAALMWLVAWWRLGRRGIARSALCMLAAAALGLGWAGLRAAWHAQGALPPQWDGLQLEVTGVVSALPRQQADVLRFRFQPESARRADGQALALVQPLEVAWYAPSQARAGAWRDAPQGAAAQALPPWPPQLRAGDRWQLPLRVRAPSGLRNPLLFDYEQWLWQQGVQATASVRQQGAEDARWLGDSGRYRLQRWRQAVRDRIVALPPPAWAGAPADVPADVPASAQGDGQTQVQTQGQGPTLWQRSAGVLAALVTGDQRAIDQGDWQVFRSTGVAHLMAISGLHITMFAWLATGAVGWLWRCWPRLMHAVPAPVASLWGGWLLAACYALFSGWQLPAQRTVCMLGVWVLLRSAGLLWPWHATLGLAALAVLLYDPWALQQAGFWLSFVAVAVLLVLPGNGDAADRGAAGAPGAPDGGPVRRGGLALAAQLRQLWQMQWRLSLVLAPLTLGLFGQLSWLGLLANLLAVPLVTLLIVPLAMLGSLLAAWWPAPLAAAAWLMVQLLHGLQWLAGWPLAAWHGPRLPWYWALLGLAGAWLAVGRWPVWLRLQGLVWLALMLAWRPAPVPWGHFRLLALDVGQGGALLVQTRQHTLLYDAGPSYGGGRDAGHSVVAPLLQAHGLRPDALVLSHGDSDHVGGARSVLAAFDVAQLYAPATPLALWPAGLASVAAQARPCQAGLQWQWDGVTLAFVHPQPGASWLERNASSCVLRITASDGASALLTGDIGRLQEQALRLALGAQLRADWLQVPHHGSRTSSSTPFIASVAPRFAVAQAGYRNRFGHPHPEVVARYQQQGVRFVNTADCGAALWQSSAPQQLRCEREAGRRYWHRPPR